MRLEGETCRVTTWTPAHATALGAILNDRTVVKYLSARIPHPYTRADARAWIAMHRETDAPSHFAVERDDELVGAIGYALGTVDRAGTASIGYYFKRAAWGCGIATDALRITTAHLFAKPTIHRAWAEVMAPNRASARVLEKVGYVHEATLRASILDRDGERHDELIYARTRD